LQQSITANTLFYEDNLDIMREYVSDESVDLVYLDPPFNSNKNYNVLFRADERNVRHGYSWQFREESR
jgi:site-specific DNA-methyltransferase (adenine-specific)